MGRHQDRDVRPAVAGPTRQTTRRRGRRDLPASAVSFISVVGCGTFLPRPIRQNRRYEIELLTSAHRALITRPVPDFKNVSRRYHSTEVDCRPSTNGNTAQTRRRTPGHLAAHPPAPVPGQGNRSGDSPLL